MNRMSLLVLSLLALTACTQKQLTPTELTSISNFDLGGGRLSASENYLALHDQEFIYLFDAKNPVQALDSFRVPDSLWLHYQPVLDSGQQIVRPEDHSHPYVKSMTAKYIMCSQLSGDSLIFVAVRFTYPIVSPDGTGISGSSRVIGFDTKNKQIKYTWNTFLEYGNFFTGIPGKRLPLIWSEEGVPGLVLTEYELDTARRGEFTGRKNVAFANRRDLNYSLNRPDTISRLKYSFCTSGNKIASISNKTISLFTKDQVSKTVPLPFEDDNFYDMEMKDGTPYFMRFAEDTSTQRLIFDLYRDNQKFYSDTVLSHDYLGFSIQRSGKDLLYFYDKKGKTYEVRFW